MYQLNDDKMLFKSQEVHSDGGYSFYNHLYNSDGSDIDQQYNSGTSIGHHEENVIDHHHKSGSDIDHQFESGSSINHHYESGSNIDHHYESSSNIDHHYESGSNIANHFDDNANEVYHRSDLEGIYNHLNTNDDSNDEGPHAVYHRSNLPVSSNQAYNSPAGSSSDRSYENHHISSHSNYDHLSPSSSHHSNDHSLSSYSEHDHDIEEGNNYSNGQGYHSQASSPYPDNHINSKHRDQFMAKPDVYQYYDFESNQNDAPTKNSFPKPEKSFEEKAIYIPNFGQPTLQSKKSEIENADIEYADVHFYDDFDDYGMEAEFENELRRLTEGRDGLGDTSSRQFKERLEYYNEDDHAAKVFVIGEDFGSDTDFHYDSGYVY